jgi:hypothetical protein
VAARRGEGRAQKEKRGSPVSGSGQRDRDARAQRRVQRVVTLLSRLRLHIPLQRVHVWSFQGKRRSRVDPRHCRRLVVSVCAANQHECREESYQLSHSLFLSSCHLITGAPFKFRQSPQICRSNVPYSVFGSPIPIPETRSAFHRLAQRNAFRRRDARLQSRSFASENPRPETQPQLQPALLRLSAMISQY